MSAPSKATTLPADTHDRACQLNVMELCLLDVLLQQLPEVHHLLEESMTTITEEFVALAADWQEMSDILNGTNGEASLPIDQKRLDDIQQRFGKLTVSMQFQDRVSQNILAAREALSQISEQLTTAASNENTPQTVDKELAGNQLAALRLGDLQAMYVEALKNRHLIKDGTEIGHETVSAASSDDDIDLF